MAILGARGIPARYGGFETFAEQLAKGLVRQGLDVTVYAEGAKGEAAHDSYYEGVRVRHITPLAIGRASVIAYDVQCLWDARKGFDLVYMLGYGAAWACWIPRLSGTTVWLNLDGLEWARSKWGRWVRWYLRAMEAVSARVVNRVIADAHAIQVRYQNIYPSGAPSTFIPYGADTPSTSRPDTDLTAWGLVSRGYLLVIARMEPENHIAEIIAGHAQWGGDLPLVLIGDVGAGTDYCKQLLQSAGERTLFLGAIYDLTVLHLLRRCSRAYIHGHSVGGTNPSLLEGMVSGCQVIAHDNPFNREVLGRTGTYFTSSGDLAMQLDALEHETASSQQLKRDLGVQRVAEHYTWEKVTQAYLSLVYLDVRPGEPVAEWQP